ncbi:DMT family transporter [Methanogenium cariaci]|jgi:drug/metabolite transporter (DMT)-like permease
MIAKNRLPVIYALLAAMLFGASAPAAKILLTEIEPVTLGALFYIGSGVGLLIYMWLERLSGGDRHTLEASLTRSDLSSVAGLILFGGILAPMVLMVSLQYTPSATASLLLNFEPVATTILAVLFFHEAVGKRIAVALGLITISCIILSYDPAAVWGFSLAALGILLTCTCWSLDNNISRNVAAKDPIPIVAIKGVVAGVLMAGVAFLLGETVPSLSVAVIAMVVGFFSYGGIVSVLFLWALRGIGTARAGSILAVSPFFGVIISLVVFTDPLAPAFFVALPVMAIGAYLLMTEHHSHPHCHPATFHEHRHDHDDLHHFHQHVGVEPPLSASGEHCHPHQHEELVHDHPHKPDIHHRHSHK